MLEARGEERGEAGRALAAGRVDDRLRRLGRQHGRGRDRTAADSVDEQAAMGRVAVEQQPVAQVQGTAAGAVSGEAEHGVGAVRVPVDQVPVIPRARTGPPPRCERAGGSAT